MYEFVLKRDDDILDMSRCDGTSVLLRRLGPYVEVSLQHTAVDSGLLKRAGIRSFFQNFLNYQNSPSKYQLAYSEPQTNNTLYNVFITMVTISVKLCLCRFAENSSW